MYGYDYDDCDCREVYDAGGIRKTKAVMEALDLLDASPGTHWSINRGPKSEWDLKEMGLNPSDFGKSVLWAEPSIPSDPILYNPKKKRWYDIDGEIAY